MAATYVNGEFSVNMFANPFIIEDSLKTTFITQVGTDTAIYGGRTLTICDTGSLIFDTDSGIVLEIFNVVKLISWSIYGEEEAEIPGYSWVIVLLSIIGTSVYLLKKRFNKSELNHERMD